MLPHVGAILDHDVKGAVLDPEVDQRLNVALIEDFDDDAAARMAKGFGGDVRPDDRCLRKSGLQRAQRRPTEDAYLKHRDRL